MFPFTEKIRCGFGRGDINGYRLPEYMPSADELADGRDLVPTENTQQLTTLKMPGEDASFSMLALKTAWCYTEVASDQEQTIYLRLGAFSEKRGESNAIFVEIFVNGICACHTRTCRTMPAHGEGVNIVKLQLQPGINNILCFAWQHCTLVFEPATEKEYTDELPTLRNLCRNNYPAPGTPERTKFNHCIRNGVELMDSIFYEHYLEEMCHSRQATVAEIHHRYPILAYWDWAAEKVLNEIQKTTVEPGHIAAWHLYNMGYIFKTATGCFGIDVNHRLSYIFADVLDFLLVTHNHGDHRSMVLFQEMKKRGKKVVTNFFAADGYMRPPATFQFGDITVEVEENDHNNTLKKFMAVYRITCGKEPNAPVIYHSGDACRTEQFHPSGPIDIWIVHPRVGLDTSVGADILSPKQIWFSHLWEMGHCLNTEMRTVDAWEAEDDIAIIHKKHPQIIGKIPYWGELLSFPIITARD